MLCKGEKGSLLCNEKKKNPKQESRDQKEKYELEVRKLKLKIGRFESEVDEREAFNPVMLVREKLPVV